MVCQRQEQQIPRQGVLPSTSLQSPFIKALLRVCPEVSAEAKAERERWLECRVIEIYKQLLGVW